MSFLMQSFHHVSRSQYGALCVRVREHLGVKVTAYDNRGSWTGAALTGFYTIDWAYAPKSCVLMVRCVRKPPLVPGFLVRRRIEQFVMQGLRAAPVEAEAEKEKGKHGKSGVES